MSKNIVLVILDGWGVGKDDKSNPIHSINPENFRWVEENYPVTSLQASGISVGLPWGEVGNSEVGHLTLGAGKVIYQHYPRITLTIKDKTFFENEALLGAIQHAKENNSAINLVGLLSEGNVHAAIEHLQALIQLAEQQGAPAIKLHLFADGKDMPPKTLKQLFDKIPQQYIATLTGRYYAMDREENWNLTEQTYRCLAEGNGTQVAIATQQNDKITKQQNDPAHANMSGASNTPALEEVLQKHYAKDLSEEFLPPLRFGGTEKNIQPNESVVFFNFREDSIRQIADAFIEDEFEKFETKPIENLYITTFTRYRVDFDVPVAFPTPEVKKPLGKVLADNGKNQLRVAETYKYAHVTYFFNGYKEDPFNGEQRVLIPSEPIPHPDEKPEMMAGQVTARVAQAMSDRAYNFILVNYANPDTIGHTGDYAAAEEVVRIMDKEIGELVKLAQSTDTTLLITSDHGNIEEVLDPQTGRVETQHDPGPVPFYLISEEFKGRRFINQGHLANETAGILSDVAPTVLELMGVPIPDDMEGKSLLRNLL